MTMVKGAAFGRSVGISTNAVRQLCDWGIIEGQRTGSSWIIDDATAPDRDELAASVRTWLSLAARSVIEFALKVDAEMEAIRNDAEMLMADLSLTADPPADVALGDDLRRIAWGNDTPVKAALVKLTNAQMTVCLLHDVLEEFSGVAPIVPAPAPPVEPRPQDNKRLAEFTVQQARQNAKSTASLLRLWAAGDLHEIHRSRLDRVCEDFSSEIMGLVGAIQANRDSE